MSLKSSPADSTPYTWTTGIFGRSGDPDVIAASGSDIQTGVDPIRGIGDAILCDPPRLKFGVTLATPAKFSPLRDLLSNIELALDFQVYYPHKQIPVHNFVEGGRAFIRPPDKDGDLRLRKEFDLKSLHPTLFLEIHRAMVYHRRNADREATRSVKIFCHAFFCHLSWRYRFCCLTMRDENAKLGNKFTAKRAHCARQSDSQPAGMAQQNMTTHTRGKLWETLFNRGFIGHPGAWVRKSMAWNCLPMCPKRRPRQTAAPPMSRPVPTPP